MTMVVLIGMSTVMIVVITTAVSSEEMTAMRLVAIHCMIETQVMVIRKEAKNRNDGNKDIVVGTRRAWLLLLQ